ncbi:response regulator [Dyadobacter chenwenxiniae]|uniref:Response regulator n=1 Tax=Dyadobacter chenwenxiniae TaxID=2906456 RepID=A0A9X1PRD2_9BACT|nr:response regulator [Dyadobacter chenwenxiniae]MCF0049081.1 response regulator [Dyadobacter chenwenxiniae]MCF0064709.1 response regulator [Dyadobacter chenwenxiniae]UON84237.1 response regulator [Dyadobacter chenwenxiniae]
MSVLKIGVVEDELVIARTILHTLDELGYSHCGPAINYTEAIELIENDMPDLLLLDIQLAGRKDGLDVAEKLNESYKLPFIFLTANSDIETIDRAKRVKPHAYIVKPFTKEELYAAIEIAFNNFSGSKMGAGPAKMPSVPIRNFMFVKDGYVFRKIFFDELLYLESEANYVLLHLTSQKKIMVRSTITDFIEQLDPAAFVRVHRRFSVNVNLIDDIFPNEISVHGIKIPIGKSYRDELLSTLGIRHG